MRPAPRGIAAALIALCLAGCATGPVPRAPSVPVAPPLVIPPRIVDRAGFGLTGSTEQGSLVTGAAPPRTVTLLLDGTPISFADDRHFIVAFDRDQPAEAVLEARTLDGPILRLLLQVRPRAWHLESLPTLPKGTTPTPEFLARRKIELDQIGRARAIASTAEGWRQRFLWPVTGRISGVFGSQRIYAGEPGAYHSGVDIARPEGTEIVAPADGVVILAAASPFTLEGNLLMVDHGMGLNSAFLHLSRIDVATGQTVRQGQPIGTIGMTGRSTGPHLHWSVRWRDARIDPAMLAGAMPQ